MSTLPFSRRRVLGASAALSLGGLSAPALHAQGVVSSAELVARLNALGIRHIDAPITAETLGQVPSITIAEPLSAQVTDADLALLSRMPELRAVLIYGATQVTPAGYAQLARLPMLSSLALNASGIDAAGAAALAGAPALQSLSLFSERGITDAATVHVARMAQLRSLKIVRARVTDAGIAALGGLATLVTLALGGLRGVTDAGMAHLGRLRAVIELVDLAKQGIASDDRARVILIGIEAQESGIEQRDQVSAPSASRDRSYPVAPHRQRGPDWTLITP